MTLKKAWRTISHSTTLGACAGFFSGGLVWMYEREDYNFSVWMPINICLCVGMGFSLGVGEAILQEVIDFCKNQPSKNQIVAKPKM